MVGGSRKRPQDETSRSKASRPSKKQKKLLAYHSESDDAADDTTDFQAVNLLDSDDDDLNEVDVDDGAFSAADSDASSASGSGDLDRASQDNKKEGAVARKQSSTKDALDSGASSQESGGESGSEFEGEDRPHRQRSKRNDPAAFATSLSKILSTKLSTAKRADPVLARSAEAQQASRQVLDSALETKARRRLREAKRLAMEKGRVRDVLVASSGATKTINIVTGEVEEVRDEAAAETTGQILETERRLRKVAQRGVVKLFNAVRAAQVKASEAERLARNEGIVGVKRREEKVTEMSRKGFLDLIASGGGKLKKGALEEA